MILLNQKFITLLFYTICIAGNLFAQNRIDLFIETAHKDSLDATYYLPTTPKPPSGYPAFLFVHGFSLSKDWDTSNCSFYSKSGYFTMCYSVRGHGKSTGGSTIMSTKERSDLADVVNFLKSLPDIDTNKIGLSGGSQGGLHGLWAIADDLPVRAVSSDVIVPHWASDMLMNGSIRRTVLLLHQSNIGVRFDPVRDTLWNFIRTDDYDSFASKFIHGRDIDTSQLNNKSIPSLRLLKWQDHYFSAEDGIESFADYGGMKKLYLGTHGHFSDANRVESSYQHSIVTSWFDYFLKDVQNGILDEPTYTYSYSHLPMDSLGYFSWTRNQDVAYPPAGIIENKFYLAPDSMLLFSTPSHSDTFSLPNNYLNPAYTFDTAYIEGFRGSRFNVLLPKKTISFTSPVLWEDIVWIGTPRVKFFVQSDYEKFPLHIQIYEVDSAGNKYFINRINYTARHWTPGENKWIDIEGIAHAHKFLKGNRLRIEITNIDKTNRKFLGDYPFVVPIFAQTSATIISDASHPCYIELPMIGDPSSVKFISNEAPKEFELYQNYPNPFNSSTVISYQLSAGCHVTLKIYNVLGQEVANLAGGIQQAGLRQVIWAAEGFPSGVYYYRLNVGEFNSVKKMVLTK